jgi:hypothetical protein
MQVMKIHKIVAATENNSNNKSTNNIVLYETLFPFIALIHGLFVLKLLQKTIECQPVVNINFNLNTHV